MTLTYDLQTLLTTDIQTHLPADVVAQITSQPPFATVSGLFNVRDICAAIRPTLRRGYIYRSGALSGITDEGKSTLVNALGITTIFDLRNPSERTKSPSPDIPGVDTVWTPYSADPGQVDMQAFATDQTPAPFVQMYRHILDISGPQFRKVFEHIRDCPQKAVLFHCTGWLTIPAGRDRTGVLAALILRLVDASDEEITLDYMLSRVGVEPVRAVLLGILKGDVGESAAAGILGLSSFRPGAITAFLESVERDFGSVQGYLADLGFSSDDVEKIRANMRA
ncbi:hypothetical protein EYZ11_003878 [Aspergillus tanneri]|uniref:Tyrosine specific protein phosphatases domain-containing protein n=1 Tax=Aspergillus tanneri TaxID=1220188 RepID=A0A4S3JPA5_9EURO|nr:hypothetical protein EYZ11_003878 [Aspergillus tanneri]